MIPKTIHYCWFGGKEKPSSVKKCISSWRKYCPDYSIMEWNESNFDVRMNAYTQMCYEEKKYAFLSDYARLVIIYRRGGIYLDTDVEIVRNLDPLLDCEAYLGFENKDFVNTGIGFGAVPASGVVAGMLSEYAPYLDGKHGVEGCPILNTRALLEKGLIRNGQKQEVGGAEIYPAEYFNPRDSATGKLTVTADTFSIHWYSGSWLPWYLRLKSRLGKPVHRLQKVLANRKEVK